MRKSNGCSTPAPRSSATKQWIEEKTGYSLNGKIVPAELLLLVAKYILSLFKMVVSEGLVLAEKNL